MKLALFITALALSACGHVSTPHVYNGGDNIATAPIVQVPSNPAPPQCTNCGIDKITPAVKTYYNFP